MLNTKGTNQSLDQVQQGLNLQDGLINPVCTYLGKTGFPDLSQVSSIITAHFSAIANEVASSLGITIRYMAFDGACSVARKRALPGSDLDQLVIIIQSPERRKILFAESRKDLVTRERLDAKNFREQVIAKLDPDLVGRGQPLTVLSASDLEDLFKSYRKDDLIPEIALQLPKLVCLQNSGVTLIEDFYSIKKFWGHTDAFLSFASASTENSFEIPTKFKVAARENLASQFSDLSNPEKLAIIEILRSDVAGVNRPDVLENSDNNAFLNSIRDLVSRGLIFYFDPSESRLAKAIEKTINRISWVDRLYLQLVESRRFVAPWKLSNADNMILSEYFNSSGMEDLHRKLVEHTVPDNLPITLDAWWRNIHEPDFNQKENSRAAMFIKLVDKKF